MHKSGEERRNKILEILSTKDTPVSGNELSKILSVSRQVIVTDIALLRSTHPDIVATNSGYVLVKGSNFHRIFKVSHTDEQIEEELTCITDMGGTVLDVYVNHKVYGTISAPLNISSRRDVQKFLDDLKSGVSTPLKNITHGFHYHTVEAKSKQILDEIEQLLKEKGFLISAIQEKPIYSAKKYNEE